MEYWKHFKKERRMSRSQLMFLWAVVLTSSAPAFGDWTYNPSTGHWYRLTATGLTWTQAEQAAVKLGGHLVTISDSAENTWVLGNFLPPQPCNYPSSCSVWIGLFQPAGSTEPNEGWQWLNGEPLVYSNWDTSGGEPNNNPTFGNENAAVMWGPGAASCCATGVSGTWNDYAGNHSGWVQHGVIEREVDPAVPTISEWGLVVMTLLTLTAGTIILVRPRLARV
jgi:hypothetical protein